MRRAAVAALLGAIGQFACGGGSSSHSASPSPVAERSPSPPPIASPTSTPPAAAFVYVNVSNEGLVGYRLDSTSGALTAVAKAYAGGRPFAHPSNKYVYVLSGAALQAYAVQPGTGSLSSISDRIVMTREPLYISPDPLGKYLYAIDWCPNLQGCGARLNGFRVDMTNGALVETISSPYIGTYTEALVVDPRGKYVYVLNLEAIGALHPWVLSTQIWGIEINREQETFTQIAGFPLKYPVGPNDAYNSGNSVLRMSPDGNFIFLLGYYDITTLRVDAQTGALSQVSTASLPQNDHGYALTIDPAGRFLFASGAGGGKYVINVFTIDQTNGSLTLASGRVESTSSASSYKLIAHPSGKWLVSYYRNSSSSTTLSAFAVNAQTGGLSAEPVSSVTTSSIITNPVFTSDGKWLFAAGSSPAALLQYSFTDGVLQSQPGLTDRSGATTSILTLPPTAGQ